MVAVWILFLFLLWELIAWLIHQSLASASASAKLPYFHQVLTTMLTHYRILLHQGGITFGNSVIGFAIGALFGARVSRSNEFIQGSSAYTVTLHDCLTNGPDNRVSSDRIWNCP